LDGGVDGLQLGAFRSSSFVGLLSLCQGVHFSGWYVNISGTVPADKPKRGRRGAPVGAESGPQGQQGDRRREHLPQRNHEPGPGSEPKSRGTRGGRKPQKSRRLCGANAAAPVLRDSVGQARWVRSASQGHGRRSAAERWCGPVSKGTGDCRRHRPR
jgi:hypothetical protein